MVPQTPSSHRFFGNNQSCLLHYSSARFRLIVVNQKWKASRVKAIRSRCFPLEATIEIFSTVAPISPSLRSFEQPELFAVLLIDAIQVDRRQPDEESYGRDDASIALFPVCVNHCDFRNDCPTIFLSSIYEPTLLRSSN
jgi:hypothetical protein